MIEIQTHEKPVDGEPVTTSHFINPQYIVSVNETAYGSRIVMVNGQTYRVPNSVYEIVTKIEGDDCDTCKHHGEDCIVWRGDNEIRCPGWEDKNERFHRKLKKNIDLSRCDTLDDIRRKFEEARDDKSD